MLRENGKGLFAQLPANKSWLIAFGLALIVSIWRFQPWMPTVFFGDDLTNLLAYQNGQFASSPDQALFSVFAEKYRPVFGIVMWALFSLFGTHLSSYLALNIVLHGINAALVFTVAYRLSQRNWLVSLAVALAFASSRFALYQVTQVTGMLEGLALMFFLMMIYFVVRAGHGQRSAWRWGWLAIGAAFLAVNTHERYIVVIPWLCTTLILLPNFRALSSRRKLTLFGACLMILALNVIYKVTILRVPFFVGTGGTHMDLNVIRTLKHLGYAILSAFGYNEGPEYLIGARTYSLKWFPAWAIAAMIFLTWVYMVFAAMRGAYKEQQASGEPAWQRLRWPLLFALLAALVLGPPALTIRLEQRWILAPFALILFIFAWAAGKLRNDQFLRTSALVIAASLGCIASDSLIAPYFDRIFFVSCGQMGAAVKRDIVDRYPGQTYPLALLISQDHCGWTLLGGDFFKIYGGAKRAVFCFDRIEDASPSRLPAQVHVYAARYAPPSLRDVTEEWSALNKVHN